MRKHNPHQLTILIPNAGSWDDQSMVEKAQGMANVASIIRTLRYLTVLAFLGLIGLLYSTHWSKSGSRNDAEDLRDHQGLTWLSIEHKHEQSTTTNENDSPYTPHGAHSIAALIEDGRGKYGELLSHETHDLSDAAAAYRRRRGRHPPPMFDKWYHHAKAHDAIVVEEFWDQIYDDLRPFWSIDPLLLRKQANAFSNKISIRNGNMSSKSYNLYPKLAMWTGMLAYLAGQQHVALPDLDIPVNVNDEPALLVPWDAIDTALSLGRKIEINPREVIQEFWIPQEIGNVSTSFKFDPEWLGPRLAHPESRLGPRPLWSLVRPACPPKSPSRSEHVYYDIWEPGGEAHETHNATALLPDTFNGHVRNWTQAMDACQHSYWQGLHSAFVAPRQMSVSQKLFPLFGDSKFSMSNEILLPGAMEWNHSSTAEESRVVSWDKKRNILFWRGDITASHNPTRYWQHFERERFVSMMNATQIEMGDNRNGIIIGPVGNFMIPTSNLEKPFSTRQEQLSKDIRAWTNIAFSSDTCNNGTSCSRLDGYFTFSDNVEHAADYKYAIALDHNSGDDAGELSRSLKEGRATLRASVYRKWFDSRLVPWLHIVPVTNTFEDLYAVLEFFLGTASKTNPEQVTTMEAEEVDHGNDPHQFEDDHIQQPRRSRNAAGYDDMARRIAEAAQHWASKVLRKEDMLIYVYRLLLEYARLVDDKRERLGWVDDVLDAGADG